MIQFFRIDGIFMPIFRGRLRVVTRRLVGAALECKSVEELSCLLNTLGLAVTRVGGLMRTQKFLGVDEESKLGSIRESIAGMLEEWGWR